MSLGSLVSIIKGFDERHGEFGSGFFGPLMKIEVHCTLILEIKLLETSLAQGGYSLDYFNPNFMSLGPLVSALNNARWGSELHFDPLSKIEVHCTINLKKNLGNILDQKEDTLGIF